MSKVFTIFCEWDDEAKVWYVVRSDVAGLSAEASTCEEMLEVLKELVPQLIQLNNPGKCGRDVPIELLVKADQKVTVRCQ